MAEVVNLFAPKTEPYGEGPAKCLACKHEWEAVAPLGQVHLECPACSTHLGVWRHPFVREEEHWRCRCGNELFSITRNCIYCPACGLKHRPYDDE